MPGTVIDLLGPAAALLSQAGIENPRGEARLLLAHALDVTREETLSGIRTPSPEQATLFAQAIERRARREPLAYITGRREFWSLALAVGPGVLIPRPETESLVEEACRLIADRNRSFALADLGTGSGALAIAALTEFPNATGVAIDTSEAALGYARMNAGSHRVAGRLTLRQADWASPVPAGRHAEQFDLIFCNPPYIARADIATLEPEVRGHEPHTALDGGPDGLDAYRTLARGMPDMLRPNGIALLEIGAGQAAALKSLFQPLGNLRFVPDLAGIDRVLVLETANRAWKGTA